MRLSELLRATARTLDGKTLGKIHEVHCDNGRIVALKCGPASLIERLSAKSHGRRIPWERVCRMSNGDLFVTPARARKKR